MTMDIKHKYNNNKIIITPTAIITIITIITIYNNI